MKNILIYRLGSLGDTCVALPALRVVRQRFPAAHITFLTNLPGHSKAVSPMAILDGLDLVDDFIAYPLRTRNPAAIGRLWRQLWKMRFDLIINLTSWQALQRLRRDALFFRSCSRAELVGFTSAEARVAVAGPDGSVEHEAETLLRRVARFGAADISDPRWYRIQISDSEREWAAGILRQAGLERGFLAVSVGAIVSCKDWGERNWIELMATVSRDYSRRGCLFLGSGAEFQRAEYCLSVWLGPCLNLCGETTPRQSAALLEQAGFFVGHDSGPMHLAAAVGTPTVAIFSARSQPGQWFPLGSGHTVIYHRTECSGCKLFDCRNEGKKCIESITVGEVTHAIRERYPVKQA